jgi:hypothetical protein
LNRFNYSNNCPVAYIDPSGYYSEWVNYQRGFITQVINDLTSGVLDMAITALGGPSIDSNQSVAFNLGRQAGRNASIVIASYLTVEGASTTAAALVALGSTAGGGGVCALVTGGACGVPVGIALGLEGEIALAGAIEAGLGTASLVYMAGNPIPSRRNSIEYKLAPEGSQGKYESPYKYPSDYSKPPAEGFEWRGGEKGSWYNPETGEIYRLDTSHVNEGPHYDYTASDGTT